MQFFQISKTAVTSTQTICVNGPSLMFWKTQTKPLIFPIKAFRSYFFQNREITHSKVIAHVMQICITFVLNEFLKNPPLKRYRPTQSIIRESLYHLLVLAFIFIRIRPAYTFLSSNVALDKIEFDTPGLESKISLAQYSRPHQSRQTNFWFVIAPKNFGEE